MEVANVIFPVSIPALRYTVRASEAGFCYARGLNVLPHLQNVVSTHGTFISTPNTKHQATKNTRAITLNREQLHGFGIKPCRFLPSLWPVVS